MPWVQQALNIPGQMQRDLGFRCKRNIPQVIQSDLLIPKRWRSRFTFEGVTSPFARPRGPTSIRRFRRYILVGDQTSPCTLTLYRMAQPHQNQETPGPSPVVPVASGAGALVSSRKKSFMSKPGDAQFCVGKNKTCPVTLPPS